MTGPAIITSGTFTVDGTPSALTPPVLASVNQSYSFTGYATAPSLGPPAANPSQKTYVASGWLVLASAWTGVISIRGTATDTWTYFDGGQQGRLNNNPPQMAQYNNGPKIRFNLTQGGASQALAVRVDPVTGFTTNSDWYWAPIDGGGLPNNYGHGYSTLSSVQHTLNVAAAFGTNPPVGQAPGNITLAQGTYDLTITVDLTGNPNNIDFPGWNYLGAMDANAGTPKTNEGFNFTGTVPITATASGTLQAYEAAFYTPTAQFSANGFDKLQVAVWGASAGIPTYVVVELQTQGPDGVWYAMDGPLNKEGKMSNLSGSASQLTYMGTLPGTRRFHPGPIRLVATNNPVYGPAAPRLLRSGNPVPVPTGYPGTVSYYIAGVSANVTPDPTAKLLITKQVHATGAGDTTLTPFSAAGYDTLMLIISSSNADTLSVAVVAQHPDGTYEGNPLLQAYIGYVQTLTSSAATAPFRANVQYSTTAMSEPLRAITWSAYTYPVDFTYWVYGSPLAAR